jgi:mRNA-degrading endonuclease YafQ of YafQ-DinJ toxin-antitoxin module
MKSVSTKNFKGKYDKKPKSSQDSIKKTVRHLLQDPKYPGLRCHKIRGIRGKSIWEAYIDDEARLTFEYGDDCIILRNNCRHDAVIRNP